MTTKKKTSTAVERQARKSSHPDADLFETGSKHGILSEGMRPLKTQSKRNELY